MALNLNAIISMMQDLTGDYDDTSKKLFVRFVNMAYRDVWSDFEWPERRADTWVRTYAPYVTGTVSITQDAAAITGVGTVFPATVASVPWRFGKSYSDPWYVVSARGGDTTLTLAENYTETTLSGAGYVLYANVFSLPANAEEVRYVTLHKSGYTNPDPITKRTMDELAVLPSRVGVPTEWCVGSNDSSGYLTIQLGTVPDAIYRLHVFYLKKITELVNLTDVPLLEERRRDLILERAMWHAYRFRNDSPKAADQLVLYERRLGEAIFKEKQSSASPQFQTFDSQPDDPLFNYTWPAEAP